jgi:hypothetical protein
MMKESRSVKVGVGKGERPSLTNLETFTQNNGRREKRNTSRNTCSKQCNGLNPLLSSGHSKQDFSSSISNSGFFFRQSKSGVLVLQFHILLHILSQLTFYPNF